MGGGGILFPPPDGVILRPPSSARVKSNALEFSVPLRASILRILLKFSPEITQGQKLQRSNWGYVRPFFVKKKVVSGKTP